MVEGIPTGDVQRHPATEEKQRRNACHDEQVEVFREIEETEVYAGILRVVACGELAFSFRKVERAAVCFGRAGYHIDDESYDGRDVAFEDKPPVGLRRHYVADAHGACKANHCNHAEADGEFVAHHLRAGTHGADEGELVVGRPSGKQDSEHAYARHGYQEEYADVEINDLQAIAPRQYGEGKHRRQNHEIRSEGEKKLIGVLQRDELFDKDLEHIGEALKQTPRAHAVRAEAALDGSTEFALIVYVEQSQKRICEQQAHAYQHTLYRDCEP